MVTHVATKPTAPTSPHPEPVPWRPYRWSLIALECAAALLPAAMFLAWSTNINVNPLERVGQVSGLAALQFRFALFSACGVIALVLADRFGRRLTREIGTRLVCAALAGLATALIAAGVVIALRGTPYNLYSAGGDMGWIAARVRTMVAGGPTCAHYPPLALEGIATYVRFTGLDIHHALKHFQIVGAALYGPATYLAWRLVLRPGWALAIGVTAALPFVDVFKPYPQLTLVVLIPVLVKFLQVVRRSARLTPLRAVLLGAAFGLGFGVLFLLYSGWFVWAAGGAIVAFCIVVPWRAGLPRALLLTAGAGLTFVAVTLNHLVGLLSATGGASDNFFYFDTDTEPTYLAMWRSDMPGKNLGVWPPHGELAGVGVFTLLLALGLAVAIAVGWRRTAVLAVGACMASAWFMRFWLAAEAYETKTVRLYPRTTMLLLYCFLILCGFAIYATVTAVQRWRESGSPIGRSRAPLGLLLIPLLFVFASAGSASADKYMPNPLTNRAGQYPDILGNYAWISHQSKTYPPNADFAKECGHETLPPPPRPPFPDTWPFGPK